MGISSSPRNLCGQIVHDLGRQILAGVVKPGESLPQETTLCDQMGVSRTVIRENQSTIRRASLIRGRRTAEGGLILHPFDSQMAMSGIPPRGL
jgi:GntR family galactonate operon transcriptional repressor